MRNPYFVADSATVTVMRPLASSVFGEYNLTIPEGLSIEDFYALSAPDNKLGYVGRLSPRRVGGLARRFMRADVAVTTVNPHDPAWIPDSNVDKTLTEAAKRVASDFFLESDITRAGLGTWREFEDFTVGDRVDVEIFGQMVRLPVTRIEPTVSDFSATDVVVHVGGQLVDDKAARLAENASIQKAVLQDQKELAGLKTQVAAAQSSADKAQAAAGEADDKAQAAAGEAGQAQSAADAAREVADETARALARENQKRILENEAFASALGIYYDRTRPQTGRIGNHAGVLTWRSAKLELPGGLLKNETIFTAENTADVGYVGVRAVLIARIDAIKHYTDSFEHNVTKDKPRDGLRLSAENILSLTVTIYPQFDFSAILADERRKRGLI